MQSVQTQIAALGHTLNDARAQEAALQKEVAAVEQSLGTARPVRRMTSAPRGKV